MEKTKSLIRLTTYSIRIGNGLFLLITKGLMLSLILCAFSILEVRAQATPPGGTEDNAVLFDQIPVHVIAQGYNDFYVDAIFSKSNQLFVNIEDLFHTLNVSCKSEQNGSYLSGFIDNESQAYSIDLNSGIIKTARKTLISKIGLVKDMGMVYMESSLFAVAFGITLTFNYRTLTITLKSNFELPAIKQLRIENLRSNLSKVKGEENADTILQRSYHLLKMGTLDWSVNSSQIMDGSKENQFGLGIGTEFLYGEADVSVNYYDRHKFDNRQLFYLWRWVDNDKSIIKQAQVGKISNQTISFINSPIIGAVIRNSPTTIRKATGYYTIHETTQPNWSVELYLNNVMVDYTIADASGLFTFKVPIVYGYTTLKLKFYGPLGEERTEERTMNIPYTVMPANEFEYSLSAGILQDSSSSRFGRAEFNYGVNRIVTIGGGLEYLSSIPNGSYIPFATATLQPFSKLTLNTEYDHGVKTMALMNYYFRKDALLEVDYTKFVEGQLATRFNSLEERRVKLSVPFRFKKVILSSKLDYTQLVYKAFNYNRAMSILSAYYKEFSANSSVQINWIDQRAPYALTDLALSYRMKKGVTLRPSAQYNISEGNLMTYKLAIEKYIPRGNLAISYERNVLYNDNTISLNFKYDLPFARISLSVSKSKDKVNILEGAQGSLAFQGGNHYTHVSNNSSVSKGGISLYPFFDSNHNGIFDAGEHIVLLTSVRITGGKIMYSEKDTIIRISDLNPFTNYLLEFNNSHLGNIAWRFRNNKYQVLIDPNQFKRIDIPIFSVGEVSGMAYTNTDNTLKGISRILVKFYEKDSHKVVAQTLSESDGYVYYMGLEPGEYVAQIDSAQLSNLGYSADPTQIPFTIKTVDDGDIVGDLDFVLHPVNKNILNPVIQKSEDQANDEKQLLRDTLKNTEVGNITFPAGQVSIVKDTMVYVPGITLYKVQLLALPARIKQPDYFRPLIANVPGLTIVESLGEDGLYHYSTGAFRSITEASKLERIIRESGWSDCFIAIYDGGKRAEKMYRLNRKTNKGEGRK